MSALRMRPASVSRTSSQVTRFELTAAARTDALHWVEDALRIVDLVDGRWTLGAVAATRARVVGVAFYLADLVGVLVDVGDQATGGFAVEADGRYQRVVLHDPLGPRLGVEFLPIVPLLRRREVLKWGRAHGLLVHARDHRRPAQLDPPNAAVLATCCSVPTCWYALHSRP